MTVTAALGAVALGVFTMTLLTPNAAAAAAPVDRGFAKKGRVVLPAYRPGRPQSVVNSTVTRDGSIVLLSAIAERADSVPEYHTWPGAHHALASITPNGHARRMAGGRRWSQSYWNGRGQNLIASAFDRRGGAALVFTNGSSSSQGYVIVRLRSDGSLDRGFGIRGRLVFGRGTADNRITEVVITDHGRILVLIDGYGTQNATIRSFTRTGARDDGFGERGVLNLKVHYGGSLQVTPHGKLLLQTYSTASGHRIEMFNGDGTPVSGFGSLGATARQLWTPALAATRDGSILAAEMWPRTAYPTDHDLRIRRLDRFGADAWISPILLTFWNPGDSGKPHLHEQGITVTPSEGFYWEYETWDADFSDDIVLFRSVSLRDGSTRRSGGGFTPGLRPESVAVRADGRRMYVSGTLGKAHKRVAVKSIKS